MTRTPFTFRFLILLLGVVALVFPAAVIGQFGIASHLNAILGEVARTRQAQLLTGEALQAQLDEETGIRGYLYTRRPDFLDPFRDGSRTFPVALADLRAHITATPDPDDADVVALIDDATRVNQRWQATVASAALARRATPATIVAGDALVDRIRADFALIDRHLDALYRHWAGLRDATIHSGESIALAANGVIVLELVIFAAIIVRMRRELDRDRGVIETLQDATAGTLRPHPAIDAGTAYFSATQGTRVGGDAYDVYGLDDHSVLLVIGDVSGKGIAAAVDTTLIRYGLRAFASETRDPGRIVTNFNALYHAADKAPEAFIVLFVGVFDALAGTLAYANAGNEAAFVRRGDALEQLPATGPVIGLDPHAAYGARIVDVGPGDIIVLATDGLTEARAPDRTFASVERVAEWIRAADARHPQALVDDLALAMRRWTHNRISDDLAIIAVRKNVSAPMGAREPERQPSDHSHSF